MARISYPPPGLDLAAGSMAFAAAPRRAVQPHQVSPALEAAVALHRDTPEGRAPDAEGAGYIPRPYNIPAWLGGTDAEARLVNAHTQADALGATLRGVSLAAKRLREDTQRITARALAERFAPIDALPVGVVYLTAERILTANTTFAALVGRPRHVVEHAPWWDFVAPEDAEALAAAAFGSEAARVLAAAYLPDRGGPMEPRPPLRDVGDLPPVALDVVLPDTPGRCPARVAVRVLVPAAVEGVGPDRRALVWEVGPVHRGAVYCVVRPAASRLTPVPPAASPDTAAQPEPVPEPPPSTPREPV